MSSNSMRLFIAVINDRKDFDQILAGFVELGITGATIVDSEGMGRMLSKGVPIFAGIQSLVNGSRPQNQIVLSVMPLEVVDSAIALVQEVCGDLGSPATGIAFTVPIDTVHGLAPELGGEGSPI